MSKRCYLQMGPEHSNSGSQTDSPNWSAEESISRGEIWQDR